MREFIFSGITVKIDDYERYPYSFEYSGGVYRAKTKSGIEQRIRKVLLSNGQQADKPDLMTKAQRKKRALKLLKVRQKIYGFNAFKEKTTHTNYGGGQHVVHHRSKG
jgi:hypothetical protein